MIGKQLRQARENAGLSLRELARQTKISPSTISNMENDNIRPSYDYVLAIAKALDLEILDVSDALEIQLLKAWRSGDMSFILQMVALRVHPNEKEAS